MKKFLWKVSVSTTFEAEDAVAEMLGRILESTTSTYFDVEKQINVVSLFAENKVSKVQRKALRDGLKRIEDCGLRTGRKISVSKIQREDWAESWKRHFKPIEIGDSLLVKPSWSKRFPRKNQAVVVLDPGLSFGTGQHATTSFCLHEIARCRKLGQSQSFLDIGTGSGILAIAAAKLGYKSVEAFDFDPESVRVAKTNAKANGIKIPIRKDDVRKLSAKSQKRFDLVCANLISNLLVAERKKIVGQVKRTGVLVLAGILKSEFRQVQKAFEGSGMKCIAAKAKKNGARALFNLLEFFLNSAKLVASHHLRT